MKRKLGITFLLLLCSLILGLLSLSAQEDCKPVVKLKALYETHPAFKQNTDLMLANVQELPGGASNPWKGRTVEDLYSFINEWFYFLPNTENGLDRIIEFSFLYYKNPYGMKFIKEEPGLSWSLEFAMEKGAYMDSPASTQAISAWLNNPNLNNEEYVMPEGGFKSFNDFFIRDLKPGARPITAIDDNSILVSPADGVINMINNDLSLDTKLPTKGGMVLSLTELLDNSKYSERFVGGTAMAVFLLPTNYHHFHAPISGVMVESRENAGDRLFGMPDILDMINDGNVAYNKDYSVFQDFRHGYYIIKTEQFGHIAMIPIGLQTIGSVVFEEKFKDIDGDAPIAVYKGDKLGHFAYGGSTVLLLFEKDRLSSISVQLGQQIGHLKP
ncbi:phosphatidylserine decarboxylase [Poritiphilus flavus]|uniref:Phosphatidylserine decarboxylase n=1 Tax=Poritiphilus flavus TaxID=2697053 RepID=A0A6L9EHB6_9FLAO|nr:phosphatidylserine decarboxylase [Poritiphilus flavus]NAS14046.1 phosphatidylserine decarboxylase [Poritiphilus flavus]